MASAGLPSSLLFFTNHMAVSRNRFRIRPVGNDTAAPGDVIAVDLANSLIDLDTLSLGWELTTANPSGGNFTGCRMSQDTASLFDSVQVESAGYMIDSGCRQSNRLAQIFNDWTLNSSKQGLKSVLNGQYPAGLIGYHNAESQRLNDFPGFLGTCQPRKLDVSLCGMRVYFKLADANKAFFGLVAGGAAVDPTTATITLSKIHIFVDAIELQDGGVYNAAIHRRLDSGPLEIPYKKYYLAQAGPISTGYHSLLMNLSTASLDHLIGGFISPDYVSYDHAEYPQGLFTVSASAAAPTITAAGLSAAADAVTGVAPTFTASAPVITSTSVSPTDVKTGYFVHGIGATNAWQDSQFSVNSVVYPTWAADPAEAFDQTVQVLGKLKSDSYAGAKPWLNSLANYKSFAANHAVSFEFPNGDQGSRLRSGLNTLGNMSAIEWRTNLTVGSGQRAPTKFLFAGTTAVVRIGKNKQVENVN